MTGILPRDPALPYLAAALDSTTMAAVFADVLRTHGSEVESCRIDRVKYRPRRHCTVSYVLLAHDARGRYEERIGARVCAHGESAPRAAKAAQRPMKASRSGPTLVHLAPLDMVALWWPNDLRLDAPRLFAEQHLLRGAVLPEVLAALDPRPRRLATHQVEIVQYVPETRLCARVGLEWGGPGEDGNGNRSVLYAKADREAPGAASHAVMRALEASAPWQAGELRTARSVLWQEAFGLHWQEAIQGRALPDLPPQVITAASMPVGMHLAALHGVPAPIERVVTPAQLRKRPHELAAVLGDVDRSWMQPLLRIALRLEQGAAAFDSADGVTLHGDLRPRNVLVDAQQRVSFIDLDAARRGPAALDLGTWIAETIYRGMLEGDTLRNTTRSWQDFLAGYAAGGGDYVSEPVLAWATAFALCQRAWRCVTHLKPGRFALVPKLIALAEAIGHAGTPRAAEAGVPELHTTHRETAT